MVINEPSKGEQKIINLLKRGGIKFKREVSFEGLVGRRKVQLRFDFAIYNKQGELQACIEFDGKQHYEYVPYFHKTISGFMRAQERDRIKNKFCLMNNVPLIRVPYWDLDILTLNRLFTEPSYRVLSKFHNDMLKRQREVRK